MKYFVGSETIDLRLALIDSAQCFSWTEADGAFYGCVGDDAVRIWAEDGGVFSDSANVAALRRYLDLDRNYSALADECARFPLAARAVKMYPGLRVLNQPPWDALLSFILSANNNVARIRVLVSKLCESLGERRGEIHAFPAPEILVNCPSARLRAIGVGYRDKYLIETARAVAGGFPLNELRDMPYSDAHALLVTLMGVGDKVADCVQLFGCGHTEAFPVDVWIARVCRAALNLNIENRRALGRAARELLGKNAGLIQQFLFHAARTGAVEV